MSLYENPISLAQLVCLNPVAKIAEHRDSRHSPAQMMMFRGPELTGAKDRLIRASVERLSHQFHIGVREIAGIANLFIE